MRAERLAALRIGIALIMLVDVFFTYYRHANDYFGPESLGEPSYFKYRYRDDTHRITIDVGARRIHRHKDLELVVLHELARELVTASRLERSR